MLRLSLQQWASLGTVLLCMALPSKTLAQQTRSVEARAAPPGAPNGALLPGDAIRLTGTRDADIPGEYSVDETGIVVLPMLGARNVTGLGASDLKRQLSADYGQQLRNEVVQIALLRRVRIFGAVKNPGIYRVDPTMKVADAVALAGGATDQGKLDEVRIVRAGKVVRSGTDRAGGVTNDISSGDEIIVPERSWLSRNGKFVVGGLITAAAIVTAAAIR